MNDAMLTGLTIGVIAMITGLCRGLPYLIFNRHQTLPPFVKSLSAVFPSAIMIILVVYCLRNTQFTHFPYGLQEGLSVALVVGLQVWRKNTMVSILLGTACYMLLIRLPLFG